MSHFLKLMHTSAFHLSQANQLKLKILTGVYNIKDDVAYSSNPVQSKRHKRYFQKYDNFSMKKEDNERSLQELEEKDTLLDEEEVNTTTLKELSKDGQQFIEELQDHHDNKKHETTLKNLSKDDEESVGKLEDHHDNEKHKSFVSRDEVKKAMLDVYGKVNDNMLNKIMSVKRTQLEEISLSQLETQVEKLWMEDQIFQEEFPKQVFFKYDTNLDGKLNVKDVNIALKDFGEDIDRGKLKLFMKTYDKDEDGYLNYEEFCEFSRNELFPR